MVKRFFRFSYHLSRKEDRPLLLHRLRDGDASMELAAILYSLDYEYGGLVLNFPADAASEPLHVDTSFLTSNDLLVLSTRPPLDDESGGAKKYVTPSHTSLEKKVFKVMRGYLSICTRDHVRLTSFLAGRLPDELANRGDLEFHQNVGASYKGLKKYEDLRWQKPDDLSRTAAYLVYTSPLWDNGPRLLCVFGMGGTEGLIWAYLLRTKYWRELKIELDAPRFVMAEMITEKLPLRPTTLAFADNWDVDILLNTTLPMKRPLRESG